MNSSSGKDKIGTGHSVLTVNEHFFPRGSLLFIEGESSREMFILRSGAVRVLRLEGERAVELATLGQGSVIGELALLDRQPRSATVQVVEDMIATVVNGDMFDKTLETIPSWLANMVQILVKRLRDTMKKTSDSIVEKSISGVVRILLLIEKTGCVEIDNEKVIPMKRAREAISSIIGIGELETERALLVLILKEMILIRRDKNDREYVRILDRDAIELYMNWLRTSGRGKKYPGEDLSPETAAVLDVIKTAAEANGTTPKPGIHKVAIQSLNIECQRRGIGKQVDISAVEELAAQGLIVIDKAGNPTALRAGPTDSILFSDVHIERLELLQRWLQRFREDVRF